MIQDYRREAGRRLERSEAAALSSMPGRAPDFKKQRGDSDKEHHSLPLPVPAHFAMGSVR
jgi:hypothetical protein